MTDQISKIALSRLTLGSHYDFHNRVSALIEAATAEELHVESQYASYVDALKTEKSVVNRSTTYLATAGMQEYDKVRDYFLGVINQVIDAHKNNPIAAKKLARDTVAAVMAPYRGIASHEYSRETTEIKGLVAALRRIDVVDYVELFGLTDEVDELEKANNNFEIEMTNKQKEVSRRSEQANVSTPEARAAVDAIYEDIVLTANAYAVVAPTEQITAFVSDVNALVSMYKLIIANQGKTQEETEAETDTTALQQSAE